MFNLSPGLCRVEGQQGNLLLTTLGNAFSCRSKFANLIPRTQATIVLANRERAILVRCQYQQRGETVVVGPDLVYGFSGIDAAMVLNRREQCGLAFVRDGRNTFDPVTDIGVAMVLNIDPDAIHVPVILVEEIEFAPEIGRAHV